MEKKELTRMSYVITGIVCLMVGAAVGVTVMCLMFAASAADKHHGSK